MAKIMLCDDSGTILNILALKLKAAGHEIVGRAKDGVEGVSVFAATKPELVILDVTMPNKDGKECLRDIMQLNQSAKVIMMTALKDANVESECLKSGAKAFLSKSHLYGTPEAFESAVLKVITDILKVA